MAVKLRLKRMGSKQRPFYRVVAADSRSPRDGRFIETVGTYNPILKSDNVKIEEERVLYWLSKGAQPTDTVRNILSASGIWAKFKNAKPAKKAAKKTVAKEEPAKKETTKKTTTKKTTTAKTTTKKEGK